MATILSFLRGIEMRTYEDCSDRIKKAHEKLLALNTMSMKECTCNVRLGLDEHSPCESCIASADLDFILDDIEDIPKPIFEDI